MIAGEDLHELYEMLLMETGHSTPERECLKALLGPFSVRIHYLFKKWETSIYKALYEEIDIAFYGRPIAVIEKSVDPGRCVICGALAEVLRDGKCAVCHVTRGGNLT